MGAARKGRVLAFEKQEGRARRGSHHAHAHAHAHAHNHGRAAWWPGRGRIHTRDAFSHSVDRRPTLLGPALFGCVSAATKSDDLSIFLPHDFLGRIGTRLKKSFGPSAGYEMALRTPPDALPWPTHRQPFLPRPILPNFPAVPQFSLGNPQNPAAISCGC